MSLPAPHPLLPHTVQLNKANYRQRIFFKKYKILCNACSPWFNVSCGAKSATRGQHNLIFLVNDGTDRPAKKRNVFIILL